MTRATIKIPFLIVFDIDGEKTTMIGEWKGIESSNMLYQIETVGDKNETTCFDEDFIELSHCASDLNRCKRDEIELKSELSEEHIRTNLLKLKWRNKESR